MALQSRKTPHPRALSSASRSWWRLPSSPPAAAAPAPLQLRSAAEGCLRHSPSLRCRVLFGSIADLQSDPFAPNAAAVTGNVLTVSVSYSGGCRTHGFVLSAADSFLESSPVRLPMVLTHDAHEDPCEAYPTRQLRFDLTRYRAAYGQDSGTVLLHLRPAPAADRPLVYQF